jgi:hypothetical protein
MLYRAGLSAPLAPAPRPCGAIGWVSLDVERGSKSCLDGRNEAVEGRLLPGRRLSTFLGISRRVAAS